MKRGAILILDEIDRGSNKLMCLQNLKLNPTSTKRMEVVTPAAGFNVIATANTMPVPMMVSSWVLRFLMSILDRFAITVEQEHPFRCSREKDHCQQNDCRELCR